MGKITKAKRAWGVAQASKHLPSKGLNQILGVPKNFFFEIELFFLSLKLGPGTC
jgi:hypothetical protein